MTHISSPLRFRPTGPRHSPRHSPHLGSPRRACTRSQPAQPGAGGRLGGEGAHRLPGVSAISRSHPLASPSGRSGPLMPRRCPPRHLKPRPLSPPLSALPLRCSPSPRGRLGWTRRRRSRPSTRPSHRGATAAASPPSSRPAACSRTRPGRVRDTPLGEWALATPEHRIAKIEELVKAPTLSPAAPLSAVR